MDTALLYDEFYQDYYLKEKAIPVDIYEPPFSEVYSTLTGYYKGEFDFFRKQILRSGDRILEIAGGDGARYTIPLAEEGFRMTSLEYSESMIEICRRKAAKHPLRVQKNIRIIHADFWKYTLAEGPFDCAILPATTLCLFGETPEKMVQFFKHVKSFIKPDGCFVFDFRVGPWTDGKSEPMTVQIQGDGNRAKVTFREFFNRIPGYNVANFYYEDQNTGEKFITASKKKAFDSAEVYAALDASGFETVDRYVYQNDPETLEIISCKPKPANA